MTQTGRSNSSRKDFRSDSGIALERDIAFSMTDKQLQEPKPISTAKAVVLMVPLYLLIPLPTIWGARQLCLLDREECGYGDVVDTIASNWMLQVACLLVVGLLVFITAHMAIRARQGTLGIQQDADEKRFNFNGYLLTVVAYALFVGVALAVLIDAANSLEQLSIEAMDSYFWKSYGALIGILVVATVLWHMNEYSARPAPKLLQAVLFLASLGALYWVGRLPI
jgi:hypothetical protein